MRLIDADAFFEELEKLKRFADNEFAGAITLTQVRIAIRPTVDAEPVRHGHWITNEWFDGDEYYSCSACGCDWFCTEETPHVSNMKYCPECGAKMDELDICREYRQAKDKRMQISILADMNLCTRKEIEKILIENGVIKKAPVNKNHGKLPYAAYQRRVALVKSGKPISEIAKMENISRQALRAWIQKNEL